MPDKLTEREIFFQAIELERECRDQFVVETCGADTEMLGQVKSLLSEHERESEFLFDEPIFGSEQDASHADNPIAAGQTLGAYKLEFLLGEGGMGEVWAAQQSEPIRRRVALKLIRQGMETPGVVQRFNVERQSLAAMDHPSIAKVLDAGTTPDRRPYFVMELINGASLTKFCDEAAMSIEKRLYLFLQIVRGVQHAHQKAVIHRDLKPSNILVTLIDGEAVPKIIDFGLAKALSGDLGCGLNGDTVKTSFGAVMGTLQYMAPEQAGYSGQDVDTRTDVYSLGVVLYELLTGLQPFASEDLSNATVEEKLRMVKEVDPPLPSTRLSSSDSALSYSSLRKTEPAQLSRLLKNELDWVVMKALQKDRRERYQSASEFADDISSYLAGEPVQAHPPSRAYRAKKYIRKNKGLVASLAAIASVLLLGCVGTTIGFLQANANAKQMAKEAKRASMAEDDAIEQKDAAVEAQRISEQHRKYSDAIAEFLAEDFLELASWQGRHGLLHNHLAATPVTDSLGSDATLADLLDRAATRLEQRTDLEDFVSAYLHQVVGRTFFARDEHDRAIKFLERAVELNTNRELVDIESLITSKNALSMALYESGKTDRAQEIFEELIELYTEKYGTNHRETISAKLQIAAHALLRKDYAKANSMFEDGLRQLRKLDENDPMLPMYMSYLGQSLSESGQIQRAVTLTEESLTVAGKHWANNHPETIQIMVKLAHMYFGCGEFQKSIDMSDRVLEILPDGADVDYSIRRTVWMTRQFAFSSLNRNDDAAAASKTLIEILQKRLELDSENSIQIEDANYLGIVYINAGKLNDALAYFEKAYSLLENETSSDRPMEASILNGLGTTHLRLGNFVEAIGPLEKSVRLAIQNTGPESPQTLHFQNSLAAAYRNVGRLVDAVEMMKMVLVARQKQNGKEHPSTLTTMNNVAVINYDLGRKDESIRLLRQVIEMRKRVLGENDKNVWFSSQSLAGILQHNGQLDEAVATYQNLFNSMQAVLGNENAETQRTLSLLLRAEAELRASKGELKQAIDKARKSFELQKQVDSDHWLTFRVAADFGNYLLQDGQYELAKPMLEQAFEGLQKHESKLPLPQKILPRRVAQHLLKLSKASGDDAGAEKWQAEVSKRSVDATE